MEESVRLLLKKQHPVKRQPHSATILKRWRGEESPSVLRRRGCQGFLDWFSDKLIWELKRLIYILARIPIILKSICQIEGFCQVFFAINLYNCREQETKTSYWLERGDGILLFKADCPEAMANSSGIGD